MYSYSPNSFHQIPHFLQVLRSRCLPTGIDVDRWGEWIVSFSILAPNTQPQFDFEMLEEDLIQEYLVGKAILEPLPVKWFWFADAIGPNFRSDIFYLVTSTTSYFISLIPHFSIVLALWN